MPSAKCAMKTRTPKTKFYTYRVEVACFPQKELCDVHQLQQGGSGHRIGDDAINLALLDDEGDHSHAPSHHREAAIDQLLEADAKDLGVELRAMPEVPHEAEAALPGIRVCRSVDAAEVEQDGGDQGGLREERQQPSKRIIQPPILKIAPVVEQQQGGVGEREAAEPVELVARAVAHRGRDGAEVPARDEQEEAELREQEGQRGGRAGDGGRGKLGAQVRERGAHGRRDRAVVVVAHHPHEEDGRRGDEHQRKRD